jgi:hypothetical protein
MSLRVFSDNWESNIGGCLLCETLYLRTSWYLPEDALLPSRPVGLTRLLLCNIDYYDDD